MFKNKTFSNRWMTLFVLSVAAFTVALQTTMVNVAFFKLVDDYQAGVSLAPWFIGAYILAFAGLVLLMGKLGDKFGRKLFFNIGLMVFGAGSLWAIVAGSGVEFVATQALTGVGAAMFAPHTLSIIQGVFKKKKERALSIAVWTGAVAFGAASGPLVGGLLLSRYSTDSLFYTNVGLILFVLIFGFFMVPDTKKIKLPKTDIVGAVLSLLAVTSLITGFVWVPEHDWVSLHVLGAFLTFIVLGVLFARYEAAVKNPFINLKSLKNGDTVDGIIGNTVVFFNLVGVLYLASQYLQVVQQKSALDTGLLILPMAVTVALAAILGQKFALKFGHTRTILYGVGTTVVGVMMVSLWNVGSANWVTATALSVLALGAGIAMTPATHSIMRSFDDKESGVSAGLNLLVRQLGFVTGIAVLGSVMITRYSDTLQAYVAGAPADIANQVTSSIQSAFGFAAELMSQGQVAIANSVVATTSAAFMSGLAVALAMATIITVILATNLGRKTPKN